MSAAAEMARAEADEVEAAEAAEADTPDDETTEPEPEPEPSSNVSVDKALKAMEKENDRHATAVAKIMGEDFALVYPCTHCRDFAAGFTFSPPAEVPEMLQPPEFEACKRCNGYGASLTGSTVPGKESTTCRGCNGQGFVEVPLPPATPEPAPIIDAPAYGNVATNVNEAAMNALIAAGYMVLPPAAPQATV